MAFIVRRSQKDGPVTLYGGAYVSDSMHGEALTFANQGEV